MNKTHEILRGLKIRKAKDVHGDTDVVLVADIKCKATDVIALPQPTPSHIKAMQQALEALETCDAAHPSDGGQQWYDSKAVEAAITALQSALKGTDSIGSDLSQQDHPEQHLDMVEQQSTIGCQLEPLTKSTRQCSTLNQMNRNWLLAMFLLEVWHPAKTAWMRNAKYHALYYRTRGIVLHDRALNDWELI